MFIEDLLKFQPLFAPAGEGEGGGDDDAGGSDDTGAGESDDDIALGGAAEGDDDAQGNADDGDGDDNTLLDGGEGDGDDGAEGDDDAGSDDDDAEEGAPDEYDFTAGLPEGVEIDSSMAEHMAPVLKELNITQAQAEKLMAAYIEGGTAGAEASTNDVVQIIKGWKDTAQADPEIGGDKWKDTLVQANGVLKKFGTPELIQDVMIGQGVGNHPEVIRFVRRVAAAVGEDTLISGGQTDTSDAVSPEAGWYGDTTPATKKG